MMEFAALLTSVAVLLTAIVGGLKAVQKEIKQVHYIVNSRTDRLTERVEQLVLALSDAGVAVPPKEEA